MTSKRISLVDNARAIACILVMLHHTPNIPELFNSSFAGFRIPFFVALSGVLLSSQKLSGTFSQFFAARFRALIVPYIFYTLFVGCVQLGMVLVGTSGGLTVMDTLSQVLKSILFSSRGYLVSTPLWFILALFNCSILYFMVHRLVPSRCGLPVCSIISVVSSFLFSNQEISLPFYLDSALALLMFYAIGHHSKRLIQVVQAMPYQRLVPLCVLAGGVATTSSRANGATQYMDLIFNNHGLQYLSALSGLVFLTTISALIPRNRIAEWISSAAYPLYATQGGVIKILRWFDSKLPAPMVSLEISPFITYFIPVFVGSSILAVVLGFFFPRLSGYSFRPEWLRKKRPVNDLSATAAGPV